ARRGVPMPGRRALDELDAGDRAVAEKSVDALEDHRLQMLRFDGEGRGHAQPQHAVAALAAREAQPVGRELGGELGPDHRFPLRDELRLAHSPAAVSDRDRARRLLAWYDRHRRVLPWRAPPGARTDPYRVWLSEIMLQQTTVAAVGPYFVHFLELWPRIEDLAAASLDEVLHAWQGLGYYARARNLHACAKAIVADHGGVFPRTEAALRQLPGIGAYTAAAIAAIAFDEPSMPVDGNIERVVARLFAVREA